MPIGRSLPLCIEERIVDIANNSSFNIDGEVRLIDAPRELKLRYGRRVVRVEYRHEGRSETRDFPLETL